MTSPDVPAPADPTWSPGAVDLSARRADARRNHERVVAAARELFAEYGLQVTVPEVAARAGVGRATVYRSYPTKDDLVVAVAQDGFELLTRRTTEALDADDPVRALDDYLPDLFERLARNRGLADAFFEGRILPAARLLGLVTGLIDRAKPSGRIRRDVDERDVRVVLCGAVRQLIVLDERDPALWRRYAAMVLNAFRD